jgi:Flp pilus assembly pilin Flp
MPSPCVVPRAASLRSRLHRDERGAVSLETILIVGAIALPVLIFLIKFGWPRIRDYFSRGLENLEEASDAAAG